MRRFYLFVMLLLMIPCIGCHEIWRDPEIWLIPDGYHGWMKVDYGISVEAPLPVEDGYPVVKIPLSGYLKTSSPGNWKVSRNDKFFSYSEHVRQPIPDHSGKAERSPIFGVQSTYGLEKQRGKALYRCTFVGTRDEFKTAGTCESHFNETRAPWK